MAADSGASYEAVKHFLDHENLETVRWTGETTAEVVGPGAEVWIVTDAKLLKARLVELALASQGEEPVTVPVALERALAAAEDDLLVGLRADHPADAFALAGDALAHLEDAEALPETHDAPVDAPLVSKRNLPFEQGRAVIVAALARYLKSDEAAGLSGPEWREAFRALAAIDLPGQADVQKALLVGLVRTADERRPCCAARAASRSWRRRSSATPPPWRTSRICSRPMARSCATSSTRR